MGHGVLHFGCGSLLPPLSRALDSSVSAIGSGAISWYRGFLLSTLAVLSGCSVTQLECASSLLEGHPSPSCATTEGICSSYNEGWHSGSPRSASLRPFNQKLHCVRTFSGKPRPSPGLRCSPPEFWCHALLHCLSNSACCHVYPLPSGQYQRKFMTLCFQQLVPNASFECIPGL